MTIRIPREFASDTNYTSGSANGTATKTDPGAVLLAQGIVPGVAMAQHINYELNELSVVARQVQLAALRQRALILHELRNDSITITDSAQSLGVTQPNAGSGAILCKTAQSFLVGDMCQPFEQGVPPSITSLVTDAANDLSRIIVIGTGGNRNAFSDDIGATWSAGGNIGATPVRLIYNAVQLSWLCTTGTTGVSFSIDGGVIWTAGTTPGIDAPAGLAAVDNGRTFGISTVNAIRQSTNGGSTWSTVSGGAVPHSGDLVDSGTLAGNNGPVMYHCGRFSDDTLKIASSADGATWTSVGEIGIPVGRTFTGRPRLMLCQHSSLMVIAAPISGTRIALYASHDLGVTWTDPAFMTDPSVNAFGVAGGKLFYSRDTQIFSSDGVAY